MKARTLSGLLLIALFTMAMSSCAIFHPCHCPKFSSYAPTQKNTAAEQGVKS